METSAGGGLGCASGVPFAPNAVPERMGGRPDERLAEMAAGVGPLRRVQAALAERLIASGAVGRLGYARLRDYARERLGRSARQLQELPVGRDGGALALAYYATPRATIDIDVNVFVSVARAEEVLGRSVDPSARRANLMVEGVELAETVGRVLAVGECRILVHGETKPCGRMDEEAEGLQEALRPEWRGGVYGEVLAGGSVEVGDPVEWEAEDGSG